MDDTRAIQHVLDGYRAGIAGRSALIQDHPEAAEQLAAANAADARHAEVAEALIAALNADRPDVWGPAGDMQALVPIEGSYLIGGMSGSGKSLGFRRAAELAALLDAEADITALDGIQAATGLHDHDEHADCCPACLLLGCGDLAILDGIAGLADEEAAR